MRRKRLLKKKIVFVGLLLFVVSIIYFAGYSSGQASVYEKAKNDEKFYQQVWGEKND